MQGALSFISFKADLKGRAGDKEYPGSVTGLIADANH